MDCDRVDFVDGELDEIVASKGAHLERLDKSRWFILFEHEDGSETAIWFSSKDLAKPFWETRPAARPLPGTRAAP